MTQIEELNRLMPTDLDKTTEEYLAIFGNEIFTPVDPIVYSDDVNCGAIANELEYVKGFIDYITRTRSINDFYGTYLEKVVYFFTGLRRGPSETDAALRIRFNSLVQRNLNPSWITKWMILDVFRYFFDSSILYVEENKVLDNFVLDGSFEIDPATNWNTYVEGSSTISFVTHDMFYGSTCPEMSVDGAGSTCELSQIILGVPIGHYVLNFYTKDDRALPTDDLFKVYVQRNSDAYFYNFDTNEWQVAEAYRVVSKNSGTRYEQRQYLIDMPVADDLELLFQNIGGTSTPYKYYIDKVELGTVLTYPTVKLVIVDENAGTGFMSLWPGSADPIPTYDYTAASYWDQCYMSGLGGEGMLPSYLALLEIIKPAGVQPSIEVVWRAHV